MLSVMYENGDGTDPDLDLANAWYLKAQGYEVDETESLHP